MTRRNLTLISSIVVLLLFVVQYVFIGHVALNATSATHSTKSLAAAVAYSVVAPQPVTLLTEPEDGTTPVLKEITAASSSVDMVMYELQDPKIESALVADEARGVSVRVLLNNGFYGKGSSANTSAYTYLTAHSVPVEWAPSYFALTHQKTLIVDGKEALIMTFNLTPKYYSTSRDFGILDSDPNDVQAIEQAFSNDWAGKGSLKDSTPTGDDLVWSPGSKPALLSMINASKTSLRIYNEEMADTDIISALSAAAQRGVDVEIVMTDSADWHEAFTTLAAAGVHVRTYDPKASLYIHAKMIIADGAQVFLGSENFSANSLDDNRELGLYISTLSTVTQLESVFNSDWQSATPFASSVPSSS